VQRLTIIVAVFSVIFALLTWGVMKFLQKQLLVFLIS